MSQLTSSLSSSWPVLTGMSAMGSVAEREDSGAGSGVAELETSGSGVADLGDPASTGGGEDLGDCVDSAVSMGAKVPRGVGDGVNHGVLARLGGL